jgi:hypothetical protein
MAIVQLRAAQNASHQEDCTLAGHTLVSTPCVVYTMTVTNDSASATVVSFADASTYAAGSRILKVRVAARGTEHLTFPRGLPFGTALTVKPNNSTTNVSLTYN